MITIQLRLEGLAIRTIFAAVSITCGLMLSGCEVGNGFSLGNYDKDVKSRCETLGGKMRTSQDKHGDFVYCLFPDNSHCAASVVRSANCQPGKWPFGQ